MSLSRAEEGEWALTICELDHEPADTALDALVGEPDIHEARISRQGQ